jgi:hypothetical protein
MAISTALTTFDLTEKDLAGIVILSVATTFLPSPLTRLPETRTVDKSSW